MTGRPTPLLAAQCRSQEPAWPPAPPRLALLLLSAAPLVAPAADWTQFRGPNANMAVAAGGYPTDLNPSTRAWSIDLPGEGTSAPIVRGDSIYITCQIDGDDALCRCSLDGRLDWTTRFGPGREAKHRNATGANPTPTTDGERVYSYFKSGLLVATDLDGHEAWRRNLQEEYAGDTLWWDLASSPLLTDVDWSSRCYRRGTRTWPASIVRRAKRFEGGPRVQVRPQSDQAYTTPLLAETADGPAVVVFGATTSRGTTRRPARSGSRSPVSTRRTK